MADSVKVLIKAILDDKQFQKALKKNTKEMKKSQKQVKSNKISLSKLRTGYIAIAGVLTGVVAVAFGKALKLASAFQEANQKFGVVFRGVSKQANEMRNTLVEAYGTSTLEATTMLSGIQDFLIPLGIARDKAIDLSGGFSKLAVDIGSFNDAPTVQVMEAIKSAMAGMSRPLRQFGVDVSETALKQMAMAKGIKLVNGRLDSQTRAQLLLEKITLDSADAMGDFARTQDSMANVMKRTKALGEDIALIFGQEIANSIEPTVSAMDRFVKMRGGLIKMRKAIQVLFVIGKIAFTSLKGMILAILSPLIVLTKGFIGLGKAVKGLATGGFKQARKELGDVIKGFKNLGKDIAVSFKEDIENIAGTIKEIGSSTQQAIDGLDDIVADSSDKRKDKIMLTEAEIIEFQKQTNAIMEELKKENFDADIERLEMLKEAVLQHGDEILTSAQDKQKLLEAIEKQITQKEMMEWQKRIGFAKQFTGSVASVFGNLIQIEKNRLDATDENDKAAREKIQNRIIELAKKEKAVKTALALIDSASAILKTMASVPFPINIPLAIAQGIAGATQVGVIQSTPLPSFARGTDNAPGGLSLVGEDGPELRNVPKGSQIIPNDILRNLTIPSNNQSSNVNNSRVDNSDNSQASTFNFNESGLSMDDVFSLAQATNSRILKR